MSLPSEKKTINQLFKRHSVTPLIDLNSMSKLIESGVKNQQVTSVTFYAYL